jgi:uncharacterized membrane protein YedE/YeeE
VISFLDVTGAWDPRLAFDMGTALLVSALALRLEPKLRATAGTAPAARPPSAGIDTKLLVGAAIFGLGWGLAGFCPGPALAALVTGSGQVGLFVLAMLAGMGLFHLFDPR